MSAIPAQLPPQETTQLAKGAGIALGGKFAGRGVNVLTQILLAAMLGTEGFGLYGVGLTLLLIAGLVATLGLNLAVVRFGTAYWKEDLPRLNGLLRQSLVFGGVSGVVFGAIFYLVAPLVAGELFGKAALLPVLRGFAFAFPAFVLLKVAAATCQIPKRVEQTVVAEDMAQPLLALLLWLGFYGLGGRLMAAVWAVVISYWLAAGLGLYFVWRSLGESWQYQARQAVTGRELLAFSVPALFPGLFSIILLWSDRLFVGALLTAKDAGIYQALSQFSIFFVLVMNSFGTIFMPMAATFHQQGNQKQLQEIFRMSTKWGITLTLPGLLLILFAPDILLKSIFGADYLPGTVPLIILTMGQFVNVATGPVGYLLIMTGHPHRWLFLSGMGVVLNTGLNLWLIPRWGLMGAATATMLSTLFTYGAGLAQVYRQLHLLPYNRRYLKTGLTTILTALPLWLATTFIRTSVFHPLFQLFLLSMLTIAFFVVILFFLGLDEEDKMILKLVGKRFMKK